MLIATPKKDRRRGEGLETRAKDRAERRANYRRQHAAKQSRTDSAAARDIGEIPEVADPARRKKALANLETFNRTYFPERFSLKFSADHKKVMRRQQQAITRGGLFAVAMPRGSGKTTVTETAAIYAIVTGRHPFVMIIGADKEAAVDILDSIKVELETNDLLAADFPELCYPIRKLEGISHRCKGQTYKGKRTGIAWSQQQITLPTIPGSQAAGVTVRTRGITGKIRGAKFTRRDGKTVRPTLVIVDDPQTDESANSPSQCANRLRILNGAVLGLGGPGVKIAGILPCTVIRRGDLADQLLDRELSPDWRGERFKMLYALPDRLDLWEKYNDIRTGELRQSTGDEDEDEVLTPKANAYYKKNRKKMREGALVAWPDRHNPDELDGLQHAMNLRFLDLVAFESEYQNDPQDDQQDDDDILEPDQIAARVNGYDRHTIPADTQKLVAFIDVQKKALYYMVAAFRLDFTGYVIDYGAFPDPGLRYFTLAGLKKTLARRYPKAGLEGRIFSGLTELGKQLIARPYVTTAGARLQLSRILIDANWGDSTDTVYRYCAQPEQRIFLPSHGRGITAAKKPLNEYQQKPGDLVGDNWRVPAAPGRHGSRYAIYDSNHYKTFAHARLAQTDGDAGAVTLWKAPPTQHRMFADHLHGEYPVRTTGYGREVIQWNERPNRPDNHLLDCYAGVCVAAAIEGARIAGAPDQARTKKKKRRRGKISSLAA